MFRCKPMSNLTIEVVNQFSVFAQTQKAIGIEIFCECHECKTTINKEMITCDSRKVWLPKSFSNYNKTTHRLETKVWLALKNNLMFQ